MIGVVLAQMTTTFGGFTLPSENGFRTGLLIGCGVALVAAAVAALIPVRTTKAPLRPAAAAPDTPQPSPAKA